MSIKLNVKKSINLNSITRSFVLIDYINIPDSLRPLINYIFYAFKKSLSIKQ